MSGDGISAYGGIRGNGDGTVEAAALGTKHGHLAVDSVRPSLNAQIDDPRGIHRALLYRFIGSTGRTGTQFFDSLFSDLCVRDTSFHSNLFGRISRVQLSAEGCLRQYFDTLVSRVSNRRVYVECNPALAEFVGLAYNVSSARGVLQMMERLGVSVRCLYIVRHPVAYVQSIQAVDWMWDWTQLPHFEMLYGLSPVRFAEMNRLEAACTAWVFKNRFFQTLVGTPNCMALRFEDLFGDNIAPSLFVERLQTICSFLGLTLDADAEKLAARKRLRVNVHNCNGIELTPEQEAVVWRICGQDAALSGYHRDPAAGIERWEM